MTALPPGDEFGDWRPAVPEPGEIDRLNTPGHKAFMRECRWCRGPLHVAGSYLHCPNCDGLDLMHIDTES